MCRLFWLCDVWLCRYGDLEFLELASLELILLESIIPGLTTPIPPMAFSRGVLVFYLRFDIDEMGWLSGRF
jgi:hypothetical protein